jgi:hypothetical protein
MRSLTDAVTYASLLPDGSLQAAAAMPAQPTLTAIEMAMALIIELPMSVSSYDSSAQVGPD